METKKWYKSRTIWFAIAQAVTGIATAILANDPNIKLAGALATIKSAADLYIRFNTVQPIQ